MTTSTNRTEGPSTAAPVLHPELLAVLERIAQALERGNERLQDVACAVEGVANRIEDLGGYL